MHTPYSSCSSIFREKWFFSRSPEFHYIAEVDLLDFAQNQKCIHITAPRCCVSSFSALERRECELLMTRTRFFCAFSCIRNSVGDPLNFGPSRSYTCLSMCTFERCEKIVKISTTRGSVRNLNFYRKIWIFGSGSYIGGDRQFSTQEELASETLDLGLRSTTGAESAKTG